jgi:hypothetical protein
MHPAVTIVARAGIDYNKGVQHETSPVSVTTASSVVQPAHF